MTKPTTRVVARIGSPIMAAPQRLSRRTSKISPSVMFFAASDRHPQQFLVGFHDLVANGDNRIEHHLGIAQGLYHGMRVSAGDRRLHGSLFGLLKCGSEITDAFRNLVASGIRFA